MKRSSCHIKKNDMVKVIAGTSKGKTGRVLMIDLERGVALVEHLNMVKRHQRATGQRKQGGIIEKEAPIQLSNLMPVVPGTEQPTRIRYRRLDNGKKVRIAVRGGEQLDA